MSGTIASAGPTWREVLLSRWASQGGVAADADVDRVGLETVLRVRRAPRGVALPLIGHVGNDRDAGAEFDVGLDDVGVDRVQHDVRREAAGLESTEGLRPPDERIV